MSTGSTDIFKKGERKDFCPPKGLRRWGGGQSLGEISPKKPFFIDALPKNGLLFVDE